MYDEDVNSIKDSIALYMELNKEAGGGAYDSEIRDLRLELIQLHTKKREDNKNKRLRLNPPGCSTLPPPTTPTTNIEY